MKLKYQVASNCIMKIIRNKKLKNIIVIIKEFSQHSLTDHGNKQKVMEDLSSIIK